MTFKSEIQLNEYASFYGGYIDLIERDLNLVEALRNSYSLFLEYFQNLTDEKSNYRYAHDKWSLKEVLLHCIDTERIMAYRALRFSRNDKAKLPGFEQDEYVLESHAAQRNISDLIDEYISVRNSTMSLFRGFNENQLIRSGIASGKNMSVRALGFVISGHELHHLNVCRKKYILD
ncbi:DinB family protein [uncultured Planktosalinus sp.]|uniref:DinB family protein n=1 Tax=uncultured Planktosalinus sp. TaxID=1810935 RepID=UPI0030D8A5D2